MGKIENGLIVLLDALGISQYNTDECVDFIHKRNEIVGAALQHYLLDQERKWFKDDTVATNCICSIWRYTIICVEL